MRWRLYGVVGGAQVAACFLSASVYGQATVTSTFDLKTQQLVVFKSGKLFLRDIYFVKKISAGNNTQLVFRVLQDKTVENTQSCGTIARRTVAIDGNGGSLEIPSGMFDEFVAATNLYTKFRDSWDSLRSGKYKVFEYRFAEEARFRIYGDRDDVGMELNKEKGTIFSTKDLRVMTSFSESINDVRKFIQVHPFDECL